MHLDILKSPLNECITVKINPLMHKVTTISWFKDSFVFCVSFLYYVKSENSKNSLNMFRPTNELFFWSSLLYFNLWSSHICGCTCVCLSARSTFGINAIPWPLCHTARLTARVLRNCPCWSLRHELGTCFHITVSLKWLGVNTNIHPKTWKSH